MNTLRWLQMVMDRYPIGAPIASACNHLKRPDHVLILSGVLTCLGDFIAQHAVEGRTLREHDIRRSIQQATYGLFIIGPATCLWYRLLEARITFANPVARTLVRMSLDQFMFTPIFLGVYFLYNASWEGIGWSAIENKLRKCYLSALLANYKLWPAVQCINFYLIPLNYRLLFVNIVALGWSSYLSYLNARHTSKVLDATETHEQEH